MQAWVADAVARLSDNAVLQAVIAALGTFILEDPTTVSCGLLVADGRMGLATALIGVSAGIAVGDVGLYAIGRGVGPRIVDWGWVSQDRLDRMGEWFRKNLVTAIVVSRFVPGMRFPTYLGAGVLRAPLHRFVLVAAAASVVWTTLLLYLTVTVGAAVMPLLGRYRWPVAGAAVLLLLLIQLRSGRRADRDRDARVPPTVSSFEFWPPWLFYLPVGVYWLWLTVRYRGAMLPTIANPSIFTGGLIGESKSQILDLVPPVLRRWVAAYTVFSVPRSVGADERLSTARDAIDRAGLHYPLVAKPDLGQRGDGVRPLLDDEELRAYLNGFPEGERLMFQKLVGPAPQERSHTARASDVCEAGILYWRTPGRESGHIFSVTLKEFPRVVGDGRRSLRELIEGDPRARHIAHVYLERHAEEAGRVLADGESFELVFAGNHCKGAVFLDGTHRVTPELLARVHTIAKAMPEFYFGRFDVRFHDLDAFLRGEDFHIVEINGAGAEATHIWDASVKLAQAYATLFKQFRILFRIGAENRRRGHRPMGVIAFFREAIAYRRLARCYPSTL